MSKTIKAVVKHTALLHNGVRYEVGSEIELTEQESKNLAYYLDIQIAVDNGREKQPEPEKSVEPDKTDEIEKTDDAEKPEEKNTTRTKAK